MKGIEVKVLKQKELVLNFGENVQVSHLKSAIDRMNEILKINKITKINIKSSCDMKADYSCLQFIQCIQNYSNKYNLELSFNLVYSESEVRIVHQLKLPINFSKKPLQINQQ